MGKTWRREEGMLQHRRCDQGMKRMRPQTQASGRKSLVDVLAFGVVFHDEPRQTVARKQGWILGSSALGDKYAEYENKVWNEIKTHKKFDMSPDELTKRIPCLKELDAATLKEL